MSDKYKILTGITIVVLLVLLGWKFFQVDEVVTMSVRSKDWYRTIKELEDYTTVDCTPSTDGSISCTSHKHTRTINAWPSSGTYPDRPFWRTDYYINYGHYERREESYVIRLSDDKAIWNYSVNNEQWYDTFTIRSECLVGINWFNVILKVQC